MGISKLSINLQKVCHQQENEKNNANLLIKKLRHFFLFSVDLQWDGEQRTWNSQAFAFQIYEK